MHMHNKKTRVAMLAAGAFLLSHTAADAMILVPPHLRTTAAAPSPGGGGTDTTPSTPASPTPSEGSGGATPPPSESGGSGGGNGGNGGGATTPPSGGGGTVPQTGGIIGASMVVNAAQDVSDTGGNDLQAARALFRSASYPESNGGLESSITLLNGIGQTFSRTINAEDTSFLEANGTLNASQRLKWNLEWMKRYGYNAHVIVGQKQPAFIALPAYQWGSNEWKTYEEYATKFVRYVVAEYDGTGFPATIFEVGNEVDITSDVRDLWTMEQPSVWQGDEGRYQHYMRVFQVWSRAVQRVAAEYPGRSVKVGGPAMGGQSLFLTSSFWHERFLADVVANGLRLDIFTHHFYGDLLNGWANTPGSSLRAQLHRMRRAINTTSLVGLPIMISEYGPSEGSDAVFGRVNYSHESAAWAATFVHEALAGTATLGSYLLVRDNFGPNWTGSPEVASLTHIREGVDYPKAIYNAFRMFTMLPGTRKAVTLPGGQGDVRGFASADATSAGLIAHNYNYRYNWPSDYTDLSVDQSAVPGFTNLAFNGAVTVERYLVDRNTSNLARYIDSGQPLDYFGSMLTRVEYCSAAVDQGTLVLPARVLGPSAVSLWLVRSGAVAGLPACQ